jgi:hypothetical protein
MSNKQLKDDLECLRDQMRVWGSEKRKKGLSLGTEIGAKAGGAAGFAWTSAADQIQHLLDRHFTESETDDTENNNWAKPDCMP